MRNVAIVLVVPDYLYTSCDNIAMVIISLNDTHQDSPYVLYHNTLSVFIPSGGFIVI